MMKFFAKAFEKICEFWALLVFVLWGIGGAVAAKYLRAEEHTVLFVIFGLIIAFFINSMFFGFIAQITEIRRRLENIEKKLDR